AGGGARRGGRARARPSADAAAPQGVRAEVGDGGHPRGARLAADPIATRGRTRPMLVLGIETSCDETAAAVLDGGREVLGQVVASQDKVHGPYGGVVPELASRRHLEDILPVLRGALSKAGARLEDIEGIAVTQGPGLVGSLLIGCSVAKALAYVHGVPLVGVNHLEGHIYAAFLQEPAPEYPFLALVVSGGHTALYLAPPPRQYERIGQTRDDAAGEAFDKVAKLLGLGYPGGPIIERVA